MQKGGIFMSSSETPNLKLPQYGHGDHPDFLGEINDAYMTIDHELSALHGYNESTEQRLSDIEKSIESINNMLKEIIGGNNR